LERSSHAPEGKVFLGLGPVMLEHLRRGMPLPGVERLLGGLGRAEDGYMTLSIQSTLALGLDWQARG